jgi:hydroxymethylglutaryl-CoA lyase
MNSELFSRSPSKVRIVEVGPRDGLQNEAHPVSTAAKIALVDALSRAGHNHIEVSSFVSPQHVPQLADAEEVFRGIERRPGVLYTALVPNEEGLARALSVGVDSIAVLTAASNTFNKKNLGCSISESLDRIRGVLSAAASEKLRIRAYVSMAFVCPYEEAIRPSEVIKTVEQLRDLGIHDISLGDTLGAAYPAQISRLLEALEGRFGIQGFALHLHDTYHRALSNALTGFLHGVEEFDASTGGLGGCPFAPGAMGNVATEDLVDFFEGMGAGTGINRKKQREAKEGIQAALGTERPT